MSNKAALDNPLPAPSRIWRVMTSLNLNRRGAPGSGCQAFDVLQETPMIGHPRREVSEQEVEHQPINLVCPFCGNAMIEGISRVENAILDLLLLPGSWMGLFFRTSGRRRVPIVARTNARLSFFCKDCGTVTIAGERAFAESCRACGADIPPGSSECTRCGKAVGPAVDRVEF